MKPHVLVAQQDNLFKKGLVSLARTNRNLTKRQPYASHVASVAYRARVKAAQNVSLQQN